MNTAVNLLLVEDDDIEVMAIRRAFSQRQITNPIHVACDGIEALDLLNAATISRPYMILLDLKMPRMNGLEFLQALRADAAHRDAVVFVLTTSSAEQDKKAAYAANVAGYVGKADIGADFSGLVDLLERYLEVVNFP